MEILIVDDNTVDRLYLKSILKGNNVTESIDGVKALDTFRQKQFDIVFMNINMPNLDGILTTQEIRKYDTKTPIVGYSSQNKPKNNIFTDYLQKPVKTEQIYNIIQKYI